MIDLTEQNAAHGSFIPWPRKENKKSAAACQD
jgi:hypothetical protein